jgi:Ca-activated chloride channel family protein
MSSTMISFANPGFLLLLLLIPPLLLWWLYQPRRALRHSLVERLRDLPTGRARRVRRVSALLRGLALLLLIVALAGPRWPDRRSRIETEGIALVLLVDVSGSMAERDFVWQGQPVTRLDAVKKVFHLFVRGGEEGESANSKDVQGLPGRPTDLLGVVVFATRPQTLCPLTLSHSVLLRLLDGETPRRIPGESETNLSDAIAVGLHRLHAADTRRKVLVLLSDGEHNVPEPRSGWTPRQAAQVAASLDIPIYTIDAGNAASSEHEPISETRSETASPAQIRADAVKTLTDLARITHGRYFAAHDTELLLAACRDIDALERSDIRSFQYRRYHEAYPWLALASFVSLCLALVLEQTLWRRLP